MEADIYTYIFLDIEGAYYVKLRWVVGGGGDMDLMMFYLM